jgi:hypothetical protein
MKTYQAPLICPVCQDNMTVKHVCCESCQTEVKGNFHLSKFNYLEPETQYFIEMFLKNRGNIKAVEKEMNVSYPTVKKWLEDAISKLGYKSDVEDEEDIIDNLNDPLLDLKSGIIDVKEAIQRLKQKNRK